MTTQPSMLERLTNLLANCSTGIPVDAAKAVLTELETPTEAMQCAPRGIVGKP